MQVRRRRVVCVCSGHISVFGLFRADCFVCVSPQELLPEEILQAALVAGKGERRHTGRWGKPDVVPSLLGALRDRGCVGAREGKPVGEWGCSFPQHGNGVSSSIHGLDLWEV